MTISENVQTFAGLPVITVEDSEEFPAVEGPVAWRATFSFEAEPPAVTLPAWFARVPDKEQVTALLLGNWAEPYEYNTPVQQLAEAGELFPNLKHLFVAEVTFEENEISWINHENFDPLLATWANRLETLRIRGSNELSFTPFTSSTLTELAFESGGLPGSIVETVGRSSLPALEHLEFWLGDSHYGYDVTADQLTDVLSGSATPKLRHLGLRNSEDPLRDLRVLTESPLLPRITTLDLSLGVLGAESVPLLGSAPFTHLTRLDLSGTYLTAEDLTALRAALPQTEIVAEELRDIDADEREVGPYPGRYVSVSE